MIKLQIEPHSEAWYEARCGRVTGTRFSKLMAGETTKTFQDLVNNLAGEIITGQQEETYFDAIMERGLELEPEALREYEAIFGRELEKVGFVIPDEGTEFYEWIGISPDAMGLEIKCPLRKTHLSYIEADRLPAEYRHQVQGQMFVTGLKEWDFMSYYPDMKPFIITVKADEILHKEFEARLRIIIPMVQRKIEIYKNYNYI